MHASFEAVPGSFSPAYRASAVGSSVGFVTTFAGLDFGTPDPFRWVIATVAVAVGSGGFTVTIGGVPAVEITATTATLGVQVTAGIYAALVPEGATGDVVLTGTFGAPQGTVGIYRAIARTLAATVSGNSAVGGGAIAASVSALASDLVVAVAIARASSSGNTPTSVAYGAGVSERYELAYATTAYGRTCGASTSSVGAPGTVTATATFTGGSPTGLVIAVAAIRPVP
jgi:predicted outer membrane repeat protein